MENTEHLLRLAEEWSMIQIATQVSWSSDPERNLITITVEFHEGTRLVIPCHGKEGAVMAAKFIEQINEE